MSFYPGKSDITDPVLDWNPSEWETPSEAQLVKMNRRDKHGLLTKEALDARLAWAKENRPCLIRNIHQFPRRKEGRLVYDEFLTLFEVPRPFYGTDKILAGMLQASRGNHAQAVAMFEQLHSLGAIEPITVEYAERLRREIARRRRGRPHKGGMMVKVVYEGPPPGYPKRHTFGTPTHPQGVEVGQETELTEESYKSLTKQGYSFTVVTTKQRSKSDDQPGDSDS